MYRSALYHAFISMHYESLIEKQQDELCKKLHLRDDIVMTKSLTECLSQILMSIFFKKPLLILGHSGVSKSMALTLVEESLQSVVVKEEFGIPIDQYFRFFRLEGSTGISEDDFELMLAKCERRQKKYSKVQYIVVIDGLNLEQKSSDQQNIINLMQRNSKITDISIIAISASENVKLETSLNPNITMVRISKVDKTEI